MRRVVVQVGVGRLGRPLALVLAVAGLAGCVAPQPYPSSDPYSGPVVSQPVGPVVSAAASEAGFAQVVARVEPWAESYCRDLGRVSACDFRIVIDDRPGQPANAFQTVDRSGRPILAFTTALLADARNGDELAFVMGHEAAHHILGHLPQQQDSAMTGALLAGILAQASGAGEQGVEAAQQMGATVGARTYSKEFELQADALGTEIAYRAGFDPLRGSAFFDRLPDPGDQFLGSHPANADRKAIVRRVMGRLAGS